MIASGCAKNTTAAPIPPPVSEYCLIASGISFAKKPPTAVEDQRNRFDTTETVKSLEAHNLRYEAVCAK